MDLIIILAATIPLYIFLRSFGGKGLGIKGGLAPSSTPEGRRQRIVLWTLITIALVAIVYVALNDEGQGPSWGILGALFASALVALAAYFNKKGKR